MKKASLRKGDYLLFNLVILLWLKPSECKTGVVTIPSLLLFCSKKFFSVHHSLDLPLCFCFSHSRCIRNILRAARQMASCSCTFWMLRVVGGAFSPALLHLLLGPYFQKAQVCMCRSKVCSDYPITQQMEDTCTAVKKQ